LILRPWKFAFGKLARSKHGANGARSVPRGFPQERHNRAARWKGDVPELNKRSIWMDLSEPIARVPIAGDYLVTRGKNGFGSAYLVLESREVKRVRRMTTQRRFALTVQPGYQVAEALQFDPWVLHWYARRARCKLKNQPI
jgi:hypothetical protein